MSYLGQNGRINLVRIDGNGVVKYCCEILGSMSFSMHVIAIARSLKGRLGSRAEWCNYAVPPQ
jgi:hypothetical protein